MSRRTYATTIGDDRRRSKATRITIAEVNDKCRAQRGRKRDGKTKITSTMIVAVGARRCRLEGGRDARVGEPDAQGQQPAEQRARRRPRQHISSAADRPVVRRRTRRRRRCHGIVYPRAT